VANTHWHRSRWTIGLIAAAWLVQTGANYYVIPQYSFDRSPMARAEEMMHYCDDASVPVVCFPRNVDSVAFAVGRRDFRTFRSKDIDALVAELQKAPRTVVLFGHRNSPETLAHHLPKTLRMIERKPMGLCEMAVIARLPSPHPSPHPQGGRE
jgi:hypothetical protein